VATFMCVLADEEFEMETIGYVMIEAASSAAWRQLRKLNLVHPDVLDMFWRAPEQRLPTARNRLLTAAEVRALDAAMAGTTAA
jgi:hypothetical protein